MTSSPAYRIRWRLPSFFLGCLLLSSAFDVYTGTRRYLKGRPELPTAVAPVRSTEALQTRLNDITDPAELRQIALERHRAFLQADHVVNTAVPAIRAQIRLNLTRGVVVFLFAMCVYLFEFRPRDL